MKLMPTIPKELTNKLRRYASIVQRYRFILILFAVAAAIGYTTVKSQSYLAPVRDEAAYEEKRSTLSNFQTIDYKFAEELENSTSDVEVTVDQQLPDDRTNPFTE